MSTVAMSERKSTPDAKPVPQADTEKMRADGKAAYKKLVLDRVEGVDRTDESELERILWRASKSLDEFDADVARVKERFVVSQKRAEIPALKKQRQAAKARQQEAHARWLEKGKECEAVMAAAAKPVQDAYNEDIGLWEQEKALDKEFPLRKLDTTSDPAIDERFQQIARQRSDLWKSIAGRKSGMHDKAEIAAEIAELTPKIEQLDGFVKSLGANGGGHRPELDKLRHRATHLQNQLGQIAADEKQIADDERTLAALDAEEAKLAESRRDWRNVVL